jgi:NADPH-dependent 2,4-dienoyl-CoA reductase/sulfur reductase-like enzyme
MVEVATRVLIAGGGVAALEAALALRELGEGRVSVEMLAPSLNFGTGRWPSPSRSTSAR